MYERFLPYKDEKAVKLYLTLQTRKEQGFRHGQDLTGERPALKWLKGDQQMNERAGEGRQWHKEVIFQISHARGDYQGLRILRANKP